MKSLLIFVVIALIAGTCFAFKSCNHHHRGLNQHQFINVPSSTSSRRQGGLLLRGGFVASFAEKAKFTILSSPNSLFQSLFAGLAALTIFSKLLSVQNDVKSKKQQATKSDEVKPAAVLSLQIRFLIVFWYV